MVSGLSIDGHGIDCIGLGLDACVSCLISDVDAYGHGQESPHSALAQFASVGGRQNRWERCVARDSARGSSVRGFYLGNGNAGLGERDLRVEQCVARNNAATGFAIEASGALCLNCVSEDNGGAGFTSSTANDSPSTDHLFQGNVARRNAFHGWQTDVWGPPAQRILLNGNFFQDNRFSGVYCHKATDVQIVQNMILGNGADPSSPGLSVSMSERVTIANNTIEALPGRGDCVGFAFQGNQVRDVLVTGNVCRGHVQTLINVDGADGHYRLQNLAITGNVLSGGEHGIHVGTSASGAIVQSVTIAHNIVSDATQAAYSFSDYAFGQSRNIRLHGNEGASVQRDGNVSFASERDNAWNK